MNAARWTRLAVGAAAVLSLVAAGPGWKDSAGAAKGEKVVPMSRRGIVQVDLEVGPAVLNEVVVAEVPTDPEELASLPPTSRVEPELLVAVTNLSSREIRVAAQVSLLDEEGVVLLTCGDKEIDQDEDSYNEVKSICSGNITVENLVKVKSVKLEAWAQKR